MKVVCYDNTHSGERDGEERGGPRGGGRGVRERDGESKDSGGQRKQHSGNAWSKGRPRIPSSDAPPQMKKYEEPQLPVSYITCQLTLNLVVCMHVYRHLVTLSPSFSMLLTEKWEGPYVTSCM